MQIPTKDLVSHEPYMRRCLQLAQLSKGHTAPNPMVGAVLVHDGQIIGEGWHRQYGQAHAEVNCLESVAAASRHLVSESTMYVSLEPCAHYGNTPPCALRLIEEGIKEVVIANKDPFDQVSGRGLQLLRDAGVNTLTGIQKEEGRWVNRRFFCLHEQKRPYIILKWAQSRDGHIAPADRSRLQITGAESQLLVHRWRTEEGAIMTGATTALNDNPRLTARLHPGRQPLRVILNRQLTLPRTHNVYNDDAATWMVNELEELPGQVSHIKLPFDDQLLPGLLSRLYDARILSVIIEGGAVLLNSFINACLWDEARIFAGPAAIGNGIAAPVLHNCREAFTHATGADTLQVVINNNSRFPYVQGMAL